MTPDLYSIAGDLAVADRRALLEAHRQTFVKQIRAALLAADSSDLGRDLKLCLTYWESEVLDLGAGSGKSVLELLRSRRFWQRLAGLDTVSAKVRSLEQAENSRTDRDNPDDGGGADVVERHAENLGCVFVEFKKRTSTRLALAWRQAATEHLHYCDASGQGEENDEASASTKERALAGALFLTLLLSELERLDEPHRAAMSAAYLPERGPTNVAPYCDHRLPDAELARRLFGSGRGQRRKAAAELRAACLVLTERWWERFDRRTVDPSDLAEGLLADLAWRTFIPTVYDAFRLEKLRPLGRGDLDFRQWRGEKGRPMKPRGRGPRQPPGGASHTLPPSVTEAWIRNELSPAEEHVVARHILWFARPDELNDLEVRARRATTLPIDWEELRARVSNATGLLLRVLTEDGLPIPQALSVDEVRLPRGGRLQVTTTGAPGSRIVVIARTPDGPIVVGDAAPSGEQTQLEFDVEEGTREIALLHVPGSSLFDDDLLRATDARFFRIHRA